MLNNLSLPSSLSQSLILILSLSLLPFLPNTLTSVKADLGPDGQLPFVWYFDSQDNLAMERCSTISFEFQLNPNATQQAVPPITGIFVSGGNVPIVVDAGIGNAPLKWQMTFPVNSQVLFSFVDAVGQSGGVSPLYTIIPPSNPNSPTSQCPPPNNVAPFSFTLNPSNGPPICTPMDVNIQGGQHPYNLSVLMAAATTTNVSIGTGPGGSWTNTLSAGGQMMFAVSDALGRYAQSSGLIYSMGGSNTSCLINDAPPEGVPGSRPVSSGVNGPSTTSTPPPSSSSSSHNSAYLKGIIVGSVLGGIAVFISVCGFLICWSRRHNARLPPSVARLNALALFERRKLGHGRAAGGSGGSGGSGGGGPAEKFQGAGNGNGNGGVGRNGMGGDGFYSVGGGGGYVYGGFGPGREWDSASAQSIQDVDGVGRGGHGYVVTNPDAGGRGSRGYFDPAAGGGGGTGYDYHHRDVGVNVIGGGGGGGGGGGDRNSADYSMLSVGGVSGASHTADGVGGGSVESTGTLTSTGRHSFNSDMFWKPGRELDEAYTVTTTSRGSSSWKSKGGGGSGSGEGEGEGEGTGTATGSSSSS